MRGRFLAYEFLFACFRVCFMHESFFAWMLSCTIYFFCVFSCPGDDDLKNDGETSEDQATMTTTLIKPLSISYYVSLCGRREREAAGRRGSLGAHGPYHY